MASNPFLGEGPLENRSATVFAVELYEARDFRG